MKQFFNFFKYSLFLTLIVTLVSCGGSDDGDDGGTTEEQILQIASDLTKGQASFSAVTAPDGASTLDWSALKITFTGGIDGGSYETTGSPNTDVWPTSGSWAFKDGSNGATIVRDGSIDVALGTGSTGYNTTFTVAQPTARTKQIGGEWKFTFTF